MRIIGLLLMLTMLAGCDTRMYRTLEGTGIIGSNGGYFVCDNETQCSGVEQ